MLELHRTVYTMVDAPSIKYKGVPVDSKFMDAIKDVINDGVRVCTYLGDYYKVLDAMPQLHATDAQIMLAKEAAKAEVEANNFATGTKRFYKDLEKWLHDRQGVIAAMGLMKS